MGGKRPFSEANPSHDRGDGSSSFKRRKHDRNGKHKAKEWSVEWARKRARGIERLFHKNQDLPANVRNDLERELAAHKATVSDKAFQKKRSAMISKYHMVRFFERKKAARLAKQLRRKIETADGAEETEKLKRELHVAEVDEAYTQHFPHAEPYLSLYGNIKKNEKDKGDDDAEEGVQGADEVIPAAKASLSSERPAMWKVIEEALAQGPEALRRVRERRSPDGASSEPPKPRMGTSATGGAGKPGGRSQQVTKDKAEASQDDPRLAGLNRRERRKLLRKTAAPAAGQSDEEDDGEGFFEEG